MKVLGLVASYRKWGNSEVLVRVALRAAGEEGADTELIRLTDVKIRPCKGCMACLFKGERCAIRDGMPELLDALTEADGLVIGAPTYMLGPPGVVKMATDRLIELMHPERLRALMAKRRASGILIAATEPEGWSPFTLPLLKLFCYACAAPPVDWAVAKASGPGEVALDEGALENAKRVGYNVVRALRGEDIERPEGVCPTCGGRLLEFLGPDKVRCPLCGVEGRLVYEDGRFSVEFRPEALEKARWELENVLKHVREVVMPTRDRYLALLPKIREALGKLARTSNPYEGAQLLTQGPWSRDEEDRGGAVKRTPFAEHRPQGF